MLLPKIEGKLVSFSASYILSTVHTHEEVFQIDVDRTGYFQPEVNYDVLSCPYLHSFKFTPICQKGSGQLIIFFTITKLSKVAKTISDGTEAIAFFLRVAKGFVLRYRLHVHGNTPDGLGKQGVGRIIII